MSNGKARAIQRYLRPSLRAVHVLGALLVLHLAASTLGATGRVYLLDTEHATSPMAQRVLEGASKPSGFEHPAKQQLGQIVADLDAYNPFCPGCPDPAVAGSTTVVPGAKGARTAAVASAENTPMWITWSDGTVLGRRLEPGEPESELPLSLLATMQAEPRDLSMATIAHAERGGIGLFGVGEEVVPGVHVQQVGSGVVHLRNGTSVEYLALEERHRPPAAAKKPKKKKKKKPKKKNPYELEGARDAVKCDGSNACTLDRAFVNKLIANPAQLAKQARLRPLRKDGAMQGYKVYGVRKGSLPQLLKLKNGDLIKSVNGRELDSMDAAMNLYQQLRNASHLRITVERRGKPLEMHYDIR